METGKKRILIVEDDQFLREFYQELLQTEGYDVDAAADGDMGLTKITEGGYNLILLDIMLPKLSGTDLCKKIRAEGNNIPVIMLTARETEVDKVLGLELGADDYVTKPFSIRELISRIKAIFRRSEIKVKEKKDKDVYSFNDVKINFKKFEATKGKKKLDLSTMEFKVLRYFIDHEGEVVSRDTLLDEVWGYEEYPTTRTVDNFIVKLRAKIETDTKNPKHLLTLYGAGYKFLP